MELEFDKEIDAILRKARDGVVFKNGAASLLASPHLDADTIAAFAENALPEKAKLLYTKHFADCDRCRRILSQSILMNTKAEAMAAHSVVSAPVPAAQVPWYVKLFKTQNLALAMGALLLTFGVLLGFVVLQNRNAATKSDVSLATEPQQIHGGPYDSGELPSANTASNAAESKAMPAANLAPPANAISAANSAVAFSTPMGMISPDNDGRLGLAREKEKTAEVTDTKSVTADSTGGSTDKVTTAAPAPPPATGGLQPVTRAETKPEPAKPIDEKDEYRSAERAKAGDDRNTRDMAPGALKKTPGPSRSGPLPSQSQTQIYNNAGEMPVTRVVSGKTFQNRDGAWYDSAYHGQATTNARRGTEDYQKLDGGLRKVADSIGGTVVIVWKGKAYRIQ